MRQVNHPIQVGRASFTLIELLVVIVIIAILAAILIPALQSARERAHRVNCQSNWKQVWIAWNLYRDDYGRPMIIWDVNQAAKNYFPGNPQRGRPVIQLAKYFSSNAPDAAVSSLQHAQKFFLCPSASHTTDEDEAAKLSNGTDDSYVRCHLVFNYYGTCYKLFPPWAALSEHPAAWLSGKIVPSKTYLFCDGRTDNCYINLVNFASDTELAKVRARVFRHAGTSNVIFFDGHCEARKEEEFHTDDPNISNWKYPNSPGNIFWGLYQMRR